MNRPLYFVSFDLGDSGCRTGHKDSTTRGGIYLTYRVILCRRRKLEARFARDKYHEGRGGGVVGAAECSVNVVTFTVSAYCPMIPRTTLT